MNTIVSENDSWSMTVLKPNNTGINTRIYLIDKFYLKVSNIGNQYSEYDNFVIFENNKSPIIVSGICKLDNIEEIYNFIKINYKTLMKFWNEEFSNNLLFLQELKKV